MKFLINERMSVLMQFDIGDISQPSHIRYSELATERRSGIITSLLLKAVLLKAVGHSLAAELGGGGGIPTFVFDVFCSLKIDRM